MIGQYIKNILAAIALILVLMQMGCGTGLRDTAGVDHLLLQIESNRARAQADVPIQIRFTITNTGQNHIVAESPTTPVMDILIHVVGGPDLLSWSSQNPDRVQHRIEWKPGESKTIEWVWIPREEDIASGYYKNVALVGRLSSGSKSVQNASVVVCASNFCR